MYAIAAAVVEDDGVVDTPDASCRRWRWRPDFQDYESRTAAAAAAAAAATTAASRTVTGAAATAGGSGMIAVSVVQKD